MPKRLTKQQKLDMTAMIEINHSIIDAISMVNEMESETGYSLPAEMMSKLHDVHKYLYKQLYGDV